MPQVSPLTRMIPRQAAPDTLQAAPDTTAVDTLSFIEHLRSDSTLLRLADPASFGTFVDELKAILLDAALWVGLLVHLLHILLIFFLTFLTIRLLDKMVRRWIHRFEELPALHPRRQRATTIGNLISSAARYILWPIAIIMMLSELRVDVGALIATAGIAGLAIGFGAQTLVKDMISGIFLLFDDTIHVGDMVKIGADSGTVEHIGVRLIKVRKFDGEVLMIPAGELRIFGNRSIDFARVIVEVGVSYEQDLDTILPVIERVANEWAAERREILKEEKPTVQAIMSFGESSVNVRVVVQVIPGEQFQAERDLRLMLKRTFDELGIEIPFPRRTLYVREEKETPPRRVVDPHRPSPPETDVPETD
ncbi:mechanosensitive ion channel family protein [Rhodocaloribacter litoris]|uniref:mechanosensitive ion channel family protein n=1 Tax=Rhodocaloribacter litoris TaxID=2558931 RepID=UPI001E2B2F9C|nr:mechanosensitive ion channel family protein [Rhodocaloribacter litoris]